MDYHSALFNENYLRFVLNAIVWTAGIDISKGGVKTAATGLQLSPVRTDGFGRDETVTQEKGRFRYTLLMEKIIRRSMLMRNN